MLNGQFSQQYSRYPVQARGFRPSCQSSLSHHQPPSSCQVLPSQHSLQVIQKLKWTELVFFQNFDILTNKLLVEPKQISSLICVTYFCLFRFMLRYLSCPPTSSTRVRGRWRPLGGPLHWCHVYRRCSGALALISQ